LAKIGFILIILGFSNKEDKIEPSKRPSLKSFGFDGVFVTLSVFNAICKLAELALTFGVRFVSTKSTCLLTVILTFSGEIPINLPPAPGVYSDLTLINSRPLSI
jgi:hypothetical protein